MSWLSNLLHIPHRPKDPIAANLQSFQIHRAYERVFIGLDGKLSPDAQIVIADLLKQGSVMSSVPVRKHDNSISVEETLINEGKRLMVLGILKRIYKKVSLGDELDPKEEEEIAETLLNEIRHL